MFPPSSWPTKLNCWRIWVIIWRRAPHRLRFGRRLWRLMTWSFATPARPSKPVVVLWPSLWLNLSGLSDSEKWSIAGAPVEPDQALFGPAVALMQQRCDDKKKEDEAFKLCLPRKTTSHQPPSRPPQILAGQPYQNAARPKARNRPTSQQPSQQSNQPSKPWGKMSFAAVAAWMLLQRSGADALPIGESLHSMFQRTGVTTVTYCYFRQLWLVSANILPASNQTQRLNSAVSTFIWINYGMYLN